MDDELRKLLYDEAGITMSDELFERITGMMTEIRLKNREVLIAAGRLDTNVYIQKSGLFRAWYFDGRDEKTYGFSNPGTVLMSYHCHFMGLPSLFQLESCGESVALRMSKAQLDELVDSSPEFSKWLLTIQSAQLFIGEFRNTLISGTAKERYLSMIERRPEIVARVPHKIIASYLGIAPTYLSYLKKSSLKKN
jgi:CRP-like cAMP-binding protein